MKHGLLAAAAAVAVIQCKAFSAPPPSRAMGARPSAATKLHMRGENKLGALLGGVLVACSAFTATMPVQAWADTAVVQQQVTEEPVAPVNPVSELSKETTAEQVKRVKKLQQLSLQADALKQPNQVIARLIIAIKSDSFPLGYPDVSAFPNFDTKEARLIVTAFGKDGVPVAAKRLPVTGLEFPVVISVYDSDLIFPLTPSVWENDARASEDIGVAAVLDVDGRLSTLNTEDLTGYGTSRIIKFGGQAERTEAAIQVAVNKELEARGQSALPSSAVAMLERIDSALDAREKSTGGFGGGFGRGR